MARGPYNQPITIRGVEYASNKDAAYHLGVSANTIARAKREGNLHTVGMGEGHVRNNALLMMFVTAGCAVMRAATPDEMKSSIARMRAIFDMMENGK